MNKKYLKIFALIIIFTGIFCCKNIVFATTQNYDYIKENESFSIEKKINGNGDITNELNDYTEYARKNASETNRIMIYIPSGTFKVGGMITVPNYTTIVAEDDTTVVKNSNAEYSILNIWNSEKRIHIYGGKYDANYSGRYGIDIYNCGDTLIENLEIINSSSLGLSISNSKATLNNVNSSYNGKHGIGIYDKSTVNIKNSKTLKNKSHGVNVENSILYANSTENDFSYNDLSGVSASNNSKIYLKNNKIDNNGQKPAGTDDGKVGHGIGINTGSYAEIINNSINGNSQCGISIFNNSKKEVVVSNNKINNNGRHGIGARKNIYLKSVSNTVNGNNYNGILLSDNSYGVINDSKVSDNANLGVSVVDYSEATLENCEFYKNAQSNVSTSGKSSKITMYSNNYISSSKKSNGISVSGTSSLKIVGDNNVSKYNSGSGICVSDRGASVTITGKTYLESNSVSGLVVYGKSANIKNIYSANNGQFGVSIRNKGSLTLTNSTIKGNKIYGVHVVDSGTKAKIEKNNIYKNKSAGINVDKKATATSIYKNELNKNGNMAIRVCNSAKVSKIKNNTIKKHNKYGIYVAKKGKISKVTGNKFKSIKKKNQIYKTK